VLRVGVVGCGYWGPNLIRNFNQLRESEVIACADLAEGRLAHMKTLYPHVETTRDYGDLVRSSNIDAVVVATPPRTHVEVAMAALEAGKHVFVEKPLAISGSECESMIAKAREKKRVLMVGHTFLYTAAVNKIKELVKAGELGDILYVNATRVNLGIFQEDINVVWDLAPHDVSILNYILDSHPLEVAAHGHSYIRQNVEDIAYLHLKYPGSIMAHVHVSWLNPNKIREITVVGSKKMLVYDDISSLEKIRIYDKGVTVLPHYDTFGEFQLSYRFGDIFIPKLDDSEPLKVACQHFVDCTKTGVEPRSSGTHGLEVVRVIEAANHSLTHSGAVVPTDKSFETSAPRGSAPSPKRK
jgi:predicted dehydrogenase